MTEDQELSRTEREPGLLRGAGMGEQGQVWLGYNDPAWLTQRHGITEPTQVLQGIKAALEALAGSATGSGP